MALLDEGRDADELSALFGRVARDDGGRIGRAAWLRGYYADVREYDGDGDGGGEGDGDGDGDGERLGDGEGGGESEGENEGDGDGFGGGGGGDAAAGGEEGASSGLSLIHISEPTRRS
eukprot:781088-Prymnesium_polylepis.1